MTGSTTDFERYYERKDIIKIVEDFLENTETFRIDLNEWYADSGYYDYSAYKVFDIDDIIETTDLNDPEAIILRIWDHDGDEKIIIVKNTKMTEELKQELMEYFKEYFEDEDLEEIKKMIIESEDLIDFFSKYEDIY